MQRVQHVCSLPGDSWTFFFIKLKEIYSDWSIEFGGEKVE